jgi:hypothetical protein
VYGRDHCTRYRNGAHHCRLGHAKYGLYDVDTPNERWERDEEARPMYEDFTEEYPSIPEYNRQKDAERDLNELIAI